MNWSQTLNLYQNKNRIATDNWGHLENISIRRGGGSSMLDTGASIIL